MIKTRALHRCFRPCVTETFSVSGMGHPDTLICDLPLNESYTDYTVEMCAKRDELTQVSIPTISDTAEILDVVEHLNDNEHE